MCHLCAGFMAWKIQGHFWLLLLVPFLNGCLQTRMTEPPRTAVEQLLLSTAADRSLQHAEWHIFDGKCVFVDTNYFESYDRAYVLGSIRNLLSLHGALLATSVNDAEVIL